MRGLKDKVAIVTGGGGAIGAAICKRFAGYGARVAVFDVDATKADAAVKAIAAAGGKAQAYLVDIGKYDAVAKAVELATRLAEGAQSAIRWTKYALNNWFRQAGPAFDASLALEFMGFSGPEVKEGLASHKEKRKPKFPPDSPL